MSNIPDFSPFVQWGDRYFGLCVQDGKVTSEPSDGDWTEYHLDYRGGEVWEIDVNPTDNTGWTVWRGKLPSREFFVSAMENIENAPPIDWSGRDSKRRPSQPPGPPPACPRCGNNRQVWVNQLTGVLTCHRYGCQIEVPQ